MSVDEPEGMGDAGREWWQAVAGLYDCQPNEIALLRRVVALADRIAALEAVVAAEGYTATGRDGPKVHPCLAELRQCEALIGKLAAQLRIPDENGLRPQTRGGHRSGHVGRRVKRAGVGRIGPVA